MKYTVIIEKGRESGYVAHVPALRGCVSQGDSKEEALANVKEAMEALHPGADGGRAACARGGGPGGP